MIELKKDMGTQIFSVQDFEKITNLLSEGEVIAFPTDTVYGVGVIYNNLEAIKKMKDAKERDANKPFPLMVSSYSQLQEVAYIDPKYEEMVNNLMPGPLTIVVKKKEVIPDEAVNGKDTIAIRMPDDSFLLRILNTVGPMFVTSANLSGETPGKNHNEVLVQLDGRIYGIVEGTSKSNIPSTIVDLTKEPVNILRAGEISLESINKYLKGE